MAIDRVQVARCLQGLGVLGLLERVAVRRGLLVVNYHRIGRLENHNLDDGVVSASPEEFDAQVGYLRRCFRLINAEELHDYSLNGFKFTDRCAMITFDDGYRDNYTSAFPILKNHGVSALFFVATDYIENPRLPWWDHISYVIKRTQCSVISLKTSTTLRVDLAQIGREEGINQVLRAFKSVNKANETDFLSELEESARVHVDRLAMGAGIFMTWSHLCNMMNEGMSVGSHAHTHTILAQLSEAEQRRELALSREMLEGHLKHPIRSVSYPVGGRTRFTETTKKLCQELGYKMGFAFYGGINRPGQTDSFEIKRMGVDITDASCLLRARIVLTSVVGRSI